MRTELMVFAGQLEQEWWQKFCTRFESFCLEGRTIEAGAVNRFLALHCSLRKEQSKELGECWQKMGRIKICRNGWQIQQGGDKFKQ